MHLLELKIGRILGAVFSSSRGGASQTTRRPVFVLLSDCHWNFRGDRPARSGLRVFQSAGVNRAQLSRGLIF
jgi:hypothetical protein